MCVATLYAETRVPFSLEKPGVLTTFMGWGSLEAKFLYEIRKFSIFVPVLFFSVFLVSHRFLSITYLSKNPASCFFAAGNIGFRHANFGKGQGRRVDSWRRYEVPSWLASRRCSSWSSTFPRALLT